MPSDFSLKTMGAVHRGILKLTGGRFGWDLGGMPVLELTTVGRQSGEPRHTMLTAPLRIDGSYVVVASRGGDDRHPAWFLNLRDNPAVEIVVKGEPPVKCHARILEGTERATAWTRIAEKYENYAGYQRKTDRLIPLVVLEQLT